MSLVVLDASAALAWIVPGQSTTAAWRLLDMSGATDFTAPYLFRVEVRNALLKLERRGRCSTEDTERGLDLLDALNIAISPPPPASQEHVLMAFARANVLSFYDAYYVDLAQRRSAALASRDTALLDAAGTRAVTTMDLR